MNLPLLSGDPSWFPPTSAALDDPNGLLALGGDLSAERLLSAYTRGIFPWYQDHQPILWWTPDPRMTIRPTECHVSRSMRKFIDKTQWTIAVDRNFEQVMQACAQDRGRTSGTWITQQMHSAYCQLHRLGFCHSIEVYDEQELVGGLYGVSVGQIFFGESMFSRLTNASKLALIVLARFLHAHDFRLIDCQVASDHLFSLGARELSRVDFELELSQGITESSLNQMQTLWQQVKHKTLTVDGYIANKAL